jgi:uroporphyrinogen-III decarboxylase
MGNDGGKRTEDEEPSAETSTTMNSRERVRCAMERRQPNRVPVWCQLSLEHIIRHGTPDGSYPATIEELVRAECRLATRYHFDGTILYLPGLRENTRVDTLLRDWVHPTASSPPPRDFASEDPETWRQEVPEYERADFHSLRLAREILGPDIHIGGWAVDAFSCAIQWFPSIAEAMIAIAEDPARFAALVSSFEERCAAWAVAQARLGQAESIQISSPYAGSSFISRETYETLVLPQLRRMADALRPTAAFSYVHTCGFLADRLELVGASGVDGIECLDPPPLGNVELREAKQRIGGKVFIKGNLDPVNVLLRGTDQDVERAVSECLAAGSPGGGYILSSACSVAPAVSPSRMERIAELAEGHE